MEARIETLEARVLELEKNERKRNVNDSRSANRKAAKKLRNIPSPPRDQIMDSIYIERGFTKDHSIHRGTPEQAQTFFATAQLGSTMEVDFSHIPWDEVVSLLSSVFMMVAGNFLISGEHRLLEGLASRINLHAAPELGTFLPGTSPRGYLTNTKGRATFTVTLERKSQMQEKFRGHTSGLELIVVFNGKIE